MKVLVTTDGSPRSLRALPHAARLARALRAELILGRVLDPGLDCADVVTPVPQDAVRIVWDRWTEQLSVTAAEHADPSRGIVAIRARGEDVRDSILRLAADERADVLAMSSRGYGVARHALLGSVALGVLGKCRVPVLVTGEHAASQDPAGQYRLVVTTDGSTDSERAVDAAVDLADNADVRVTLLRVHVQRLGDRGDAAELAAAEEDLNGLRKRFRDSSAVETVVRAIVKLGGVDTAILEAAGEFKASAIAISTHGHSARHHVFAGSVAMGVLGRAEVPVLLVRSGPARA
ncbi:MAG: universal stress protein [Dehalococcoidia bacterium]